MVLHKGGCHCGRVRFEVLAPARLEVADCNCSICSKSGFLHLIVPKSRFRLLQGALTYRDDRLRLRLLQGEESLTTYTFNTGTAKHLFCATCGIKSFYVPRSHPDGYSVNARCLDPGTVEGIEVKPFDGREWEKQLPEGRGSFPNE